MAIRCRATHADCAGIGAEVAELFALEPQRLRDAVERAQESGVGQAADRIVERGIPCGAKAVRVAAAAQAIGGRRRQADALARVGHAAAFAERVDEVDLLFGRPAIAAFARGGEDEVVRRGERACVVGRRPARLGDANGTARLVRILRAGAKGGEVGGDLVVLHPAG